MLSKLEKYGPLNSHDLLKIVALLLMTIDHVGAYLLPEQVWLRVIGRVSVPIWFFLIGYARTRKGSEALLWGALILVLANHFTYYPLFPMNVLISIIVCRVFLLIEDRLRVAERFPIPTLVVLFVLNIPMYLFWEYGAIAIMFAYAGHMTRLGLRRWGHIVFWIGTMATYVVWQLTHFSFDALQSGVLVFGIGCVGWVLYHYKDRALRSQPPSLLDVAGRVLARYSLEYYTAHRVVLQVIGTFLLHTHPLVPRLFA